jgi:hypothetical protein
MRLLHDQQKPGQTRERAAAAGRPTGDGAVTEEPPRVHVHLRMQMHVNKVMIRIS